MIQDYYTDSFKHISGQPHTGKYIDALSFAVYDLSTSTGNMW